MSEKLRHGWRETDPIGFGFVDGFGETIDPIEFRGDMYASSDGEGRERFHMSDIEVYGKELAYRFVGNVISQAYRSLRSVISRKRTVRSELKDLAV